MRIQLGCGHFYTHITSVSLLQAPDTVIGVGIKPPAKCPKCVAAEQAEVEVKGASE